MRVKAHSPFLQGPSPRLYAKFYWLWKISRVNANFDVDVCIEAIIKGLSAGSTRVEKRLWGGGGFVEGGIF
jgi:hypothetical protein